MELGDTEPIEFSFTLLSSEEIDNELLLNRTLNLIIVDNKNNTIEQNHRKGLSNEMAFFISRERKILNQIKKRK